MRRRNRFFSGILCAALLLPLTPAAQAQPQQAASETAPAENGAPVAVSENGITLTKTAVPTSAGAWDVTLSVTGGDAQRLTGTIDLVLLLDCSLSMAAPVKGGARAAKAAGAAKQANAAQPEHAAVLPLPLPALRPGAVQKTSLARRGVPVRSAAPQPSAAPADVARIAVAKAAAANFLTALQSADVPVRVGVVAYAGTAKTLLSPTSLTDAAGMAAVQNTVSNLWQIAYGADDLCYGGGGANLERGFAATAALLKESDAAAKYVVVLGSARPDTVGDDAKSCVVPQSDDAYRAETEVKKATKLAAQELQSAGAAQVFTVGVGTAALRGFASPGADYTASADSLDETLRALVPLLPQRVQAPVVTEVLGDSFAVGKDSAVCDLSVAREESGAQPCVTLSEDGRTLRWNLGAGLAQGKPATLRYTACLADVAYARAGEVQPLGSAVLSGNVVRADGALRTVTVPFPVPTVCYRTGTLRVYSSGLPAAIQGTAQSMGATLVTKTAFFAVEKPAAPDGWRLADVAVNGEICAPAAFAQTTGYRLPVRAGAQTVEYRYVPAPRSPAQWSYTVCYYRDGLLLPERTYTASVSAAAPVVDSVRERLTLPENCCENPTCALPRTLKTDGETIRVDYLTLPRADAQVYVKHLYYEKQTDGPLAGTCVTTPAQDQEKCAVRDLFSPAYGGKIYMPVQATLTAEPQTGGAQPVQAAPENIALGGSFACAEGVCYTLEIRYLPVSGTAAPQPASSAVSP
ncbi:MAG: VWA domain-containing protein [Ruthenibacterium sp.]